MKYYIVKITFTNSVIETYQTEFPVFTKKYLCFESLNGNFHTIARDSVKVVEINAVR